MSFSAVFSFFFTLTAPFMLISSPAGSSFKWKRSLKKNRKRNCRTNIRQTQREFGCRTQWIIEIQTDLKVRSSIRGGHSFTLIKIIIKLLNYWSTEVLLLIRESSREMSAFSVISKPNKRIQKSSTETCVHQFFFYQFVCFATTRWSSFFLLRFHTLIHMRHKKHTTGTRGSS